MSQPSSIFDVFKQLKLKTTPHRIEILKILRTASQPIPADDIYAELRKINHNISLSTVYRTLETLSENSLVNKIGIENDNRTLYEPVADSHHHFLICLGCGKIIKIDECPLPENLEKSLEDQNNFKIVSHKLEHYGYCAKCQKLTNDDLKNKLHN
ncbi:MAG: Fur family transcriptional regulator [Candidatus Izemoplasmatales bacterium]|jgi:Fur family ferric uptake transcriptional regulator|nr:Fur family transcriptional regulator [Candidatus Izemoplasmatales bacterium]